MKNSIALILTLFINISFAHSQESIYSFKEVFEISIPAKLSMSSGNSNMKVISHEKENIEVYFIISKNQELLRINKEELSEIMKDQLSLSVIQTSNELKLAIESKVKDGYIESSQAIIIDFLVYVPKQTSCNLLSSDGDIYLEGLIANQQCKTSDGDINLFNLEGDIIAKTSDGDIIIENVKGTIDSQSMDGKVIKNQR